MPTGGKIASFDRLRMRVRADSAVYQAAIVTSGIASFPMR